MNRSVAFTYRNELPADTLVPNNKPNRPELFTKLRQRDLLPIVTLHGEEAFIDDRVKALTLIGSKERSVELGHRSLESIQVIVNWLDRSIKKELLPRPDLLPSMINENSTRSLAFRKIRAHTEVLGPLALDMPTALITSGETIDAFLEENNAQAMIIKPNSGSNTKGIMKVPRANVPALLHDHPDIIGSHIIQPAYDFTQRFPASVTAYDNASREAFDGWNVADQNKELRVYGFHSPECTDVFPVARAMKNGEQWFFVDPDSLPSRVIEGTRQAIARTAEVTEAQAVMGTVDYGYGHVDDGPSDWHAIELNGRMPYLIGYDKHAGVADAIREQFADQILATAMHAV